MWLSLLRLAPYLIGAGVVIGAVWMIYSWGYSSADRDWRLKWERHQVALFESMSKRQNQYIAAQTTKQRGEREASRIASIPRPDAGLCDAGPEWLRGTETGVRIANRAAGTD